MSDAPAQARSLTLLKQGQISRRDLFAKIGMLLNGLAVVVLATPVIGYLVSPILARRPRTVSALDHARRAGRISRRPDPAGEV